MTSPRGKDIAAVHTAGQYEHIEIVLAENQPALVLDIQTWITEEAADGNQLLIVDLQHIAALQALGNHLSSIEVLTKIDVENLQTILLEYDRGTYRWYCGLPHCAEPENPSKQHRHWQQSP